MISGVDKRSDADVPLGFLLSRGVSGKPFFCFRTNFTFSATAFQQRLEEAADEFYARDMLWASLCIGILPLEIRTPFGNPALVKYVMGLTRL